MKISIKYIFVLLVIVCVQTVFAQPAANAQNTESLRNQALKLYREKKFDEALKLAQQIVQIKEKALGADHLEVAAALADVATIEVASGNLKNGENTLRRVIAIYESKPNLTKDENLALARIFDVSGYIKLRDEKYPKAIEDYLRALAIKEKYTGTESLETAKSLWQVANVYLADGDYQKSYEYYERALKIRSANMNWVGYDEVRDALQRYECAANKSGNGAVAYALIKEIDDKIDEQSKQTILKDGVVNGKAAKLVKPRYPERASSKGATGRLEVRVTIDETGRVIFACSVSGHPVFYKNAEDAALASVFSPTQINGRPVKVVGIIVYNFVR